MHKAGPVRGGKVAGSQPKDFDQAWLRRDVVVFDVPRVNALSDSLGDQRVAFERITLLGEKTRIFEREDCLISKSPDKIDLSSRERLNPFACKCNDPDRTTLSQQR